MNSRTIVLACLLVLSLVAAGYVFYQPNPCREPLTYSIGQVDERFGIATSTFLGIVEEAEKPWEEVVGKQMFVYDPSAEFTINLIFDDRQQDTILSQEVEEELEKLEGAREEVLSHYEDLVQQYKNARRTFEQLDQQYTSMLDDYNEDVRRINNKKNATQQEIDEINERKADLERLREQVQRQQTIVNSLVESINEVARQERNIISEYNSKANTYEEFYGGAREFEQGQYTMNEINIYQFNQANDLRLVLAHEFGHALGIDHVDQPASVMYRLMKQQQLSPIQLTSADKNALTDICQQSSWVFLR